MEKLDIVVFGATGFTGKYAAKNLALLIKNEYTDIKWGISGRSTEKMRTLLEDLKEIGIDISKLTTIECDVNNEKSLKRMAEKTKVLMNCVGPYTDFGEPVVKACVEAGTHYLDITAELHFMVNIYRMYNKVAENVNTLVIAGCGYGSIPADMGLIHLEKYFQGTLQTVECYSVLDIPKRAYIPGPNKCLLHYGTWASLVHELRNFKQYQELKRQTFPESFKEELPEEMKKSFFHKYKGKCWFPYPGPDHDIVERTQAYLKEKEGKKPIHFKIYTTMPLLIHMIILVPAFFLYYCLCYFKCFMKLLWRFPGFFTLGFVSHKGPSEEMARDTKYNFTFYGKGSNEAEQSGTLQNNMTLRVSGSDPGYHTTGMLFALSAITLIKDKSKMPTGGVLTTGSAFKNTQLVERLSNNGIKFEFISSQ